MAQKSDEVRKSLRQALWNLFGTFLLVLSKKRLQKRERNEGGYAVFFLYLWVQTCSVMLRGELYTMEVNVLTILFVNKIAAMEVPLFRGAVIAAVGQESSVLLHNHEGNNYRYAYPLIQYKRLNGKAAIVCIQEGLQVMGKLVVDEKMPICLGKAHEMVLQVADVEFVQHELKLEAEVCRYYALYHWLPLNSENYKKYVETDSLVERVRMLERILTGNLLSVASGLGVYVDSTISVCITELCSKPRVVVYKGVKMMAFDLEFKSNLCLPYNIGIGKGSSLGYGIIEKAKENGNGGGQRP